jgi:hypothetical protein
MLAEKPAWSVALYMAFGKFGISFLRDPDPLLVLLEADYHWLSLEQQRPCVLGLHALFDSDTVHGGGADGKPLEGKQACDALLAERGMGKGELENPLSADFLGQVSSLLGRMISRQKTYTQGHDRASSPAPLGAGMVLFAMIDCPGRSSFFIWDDSL